MLRLLRLLRCLTVPRDPTSGSSGQSQTMSLVEATANVVVGFVLALLTQIVVFPMLGLAASLSDNLILSVVFTAVSIARSYALRRLFNTLHGH